MDELDLLRTQVIRKVLTKARRIQILSKRHNASSVSKNPKPVIRFQDIQFEVERQYQGS